MSWRKYTQNLITLVVFFLAMAAAMALFGFGPSAEAQDSGPSLQERQVKALETIASEMSRMRREKCR